MEQIKGFKNARILTENGIVKTNLIIENGIIAKLGDFECRGLTELDADKIIIPAFIDQHIHGADGADAIDGTKEALSKVANALAREGTAAFLATTTTESRDCLERALITVKEYIKESPAEGAEILGVHLEGPFISEEYLGAQLPEYAVFPNINCFKHYEDVSGNNIRLVSMAVEAEGGEELYRYLIPRGIVASIGHSAAGYEDIKKAVAAGVSCVTHTYNAQRPLHHREVGVVGSAMLFDELYCEVICDGIHLSFPAVKLLQKNKPEDKLVLITDSLRAKYLPDGVYAEPGGQVINVKDGEARLPDGTLAGSTLKMNIAVKNIMQQLKLPLETAVKYATENPAKCLGVFDRLGSIAEGKLANLVIVDKHINVYETIRGGISVYRSK